MALAPACQAIADEIAAMEAEKRDLQLELQSAPTNQKAFLAAQIKSLIRQVAAANVRLTNCIMTSGPTAPPPPPPLDSVLSGTATLTTTFAQATGPFVVPVSIQATFNGARTFVGITSFPPLTAQFNTPLGPNTCTITKASGGTGSYAAGQMSIPIVLHFDQSIDLPFFDEDSNLSLVLSTNAPGQPVNTSGQIMLSGSGTFTGGVLNGSSGTVAVDGAFNPVP